MAAKVGPLTGGSQIRCLIAYFTTRTVETRGQSRAHSFACRRAIVEARTRFECAYAVRRNQWKYTGRYDGRVRNNKGRQLTPSVFIFINTYFYFILKEVPTD